MNSQHESGTVKTVSQTTLGGNDFWVDVPTSELEAIDLSDEDEFDLTAHWKGGQPFSAEMKHIYRWLEIRGQFFNIKSINLISPEKLKLRISHANGPSPYV